MLVFITDELNFNKIVCKWKLVFDNDIPIDVKSKVL